MMPMSRNALIIILTAVVTSLGIAQGNIDKEAKNILEKLSKEYNSYASMEVTFDLILDLPDQSPETQNGKVIQKGDKYVLDLDDQAIYCDGNYVWLHLKDNEEVQINDIDEDADDAFLTPKDMMTIYESDDYTYGITGTEKSKGTSITLIEFKPTDPDSEYSKLRLSVDKKANRMTSMKVFSKDGSKYTLVVKDIIKNKDFADAAFVFDPKKFPGIHVEDLRL